jgi:hypothetical protein
VIIESLQDLLRILFEPIRTLIQDYANDLVRTVVGTPHPDAVFSRPTNDVWPELYDYYWETMLPLSLSLWALSIGLVIFFESTSNLFGGYQTSQLKRRAFSGLLGILAWWWIAALSLRLIAALTSFLVPDLSEITFFETLSFSAMGVLGIVLALATDFVLFALIAVVYFVRVIALYLFVLLMPLLIVFWIPGVGPLSLSSHFMKRLAGFYVPFLFMTVPVAIFFRLGGILGASFAPTMGGFGAWLSALVLPFVALLSPIVLFWQAGALFFIGDRVSRRISTQRAQQRLARGGAMTQQGTHVSRNFGRGLRRTGALTPEGSREFGTGDSRANRAGFAVRSGVSNATSALLSGVRAPVPSRQSQDTASTQFEALRERTRRGNRSTDRPSQPTEPSKESGSTGPSTFEPGERPARTEGRGDRPADDSERGR